MKIDISIPKEAGLLIRDLQKHGHKAYVVGGCVRDAFLGKEPHDWDICTSATPEEMQEIFKEYFTIPTGLKHGTITVIPGSEPYEVTTFRIDGDYSDGRHPDSVSFTKDISEDLARRDFTINAMAYNEEEGLVDPFHGQRALEQEVIRCVGNAKDRFKEDALRIMRAIRFSAKLGFDIDAGTSMAIHSLRDRLEGISQERITSEFCKIVQTDRFHEKLAFYPDVFSVFIPEIEPMIGFNQRNPYHEYDAFYHTLHALENCKSDDLVTRLAVFFHDIGKPSCAVTDKEDPGRLHFYGHGEVSAEMTRQIMRRMKFDNDTIRKVCELVFYHDSRFEVSEKHVRRWLNRIGPEQFGRLLDVREADIRGQSKKADPARIEKVQKIRAILSEVLEKEQCFTLADLAVNGRDLIEIGFKPGKELGDTLGILLRLVIDGEMENDKRILLEEADRFLSKEEKEACEEHEI